MSAGKPPLGTILASFFNDYLKLQRGLRPNSITSYADAMRLLCSSLGQLARRKSPNLASTISMLMSCASS
jgi:hypothetical protein